MKPEKNLTKLIRSIDVRPDEDRCRQTLEAMRKAQSAATGNDAPSIWRTFMKTRMTQFTAAAAVLIIGLVIWTQLAFVQPTFADIVRPIMTAQTLIYDFITGPEESKAPIMHDIIKDNRIRRTISTMPDMIMVLDPENSKMLHLDLKGKKATYFDLKGPLQSGTQYFLKLVRDMLVQVQTQTEPELAPVSLGTKEIDGRKAVGFAAGGENQRIEIWADVKTSLPIVLILQIGPQITTLKNFEFDVPVDDALVSMDIPAGYTEQKTTMDISDATEADFIAGLKVWAEVFLNGYFPESVTTDQYMKMAPKLKDAVIKLHLSPEQAQQFGINFMKGMMFINLAAAKGNEDWHYAGSGVKLGDSSKAIFWYKPKGASDYRVIYGDLRTEDVPANCLPK